MKRLLWCVLYLTCTNAYGDDGAVQENNVYSAAPGVSVIACSAEEVKQFRCQGSDRYYYPAQYLQHLLPGAELVRITTVMFRGKPESYVIEYRKVGK